MCVAATDRVSIRYAVFNLCSYIMIYHSVWRLCAEFLGLQLDASKVHYMYFSKITSKTVAVTLYIARLLKVKK